MKGLREKAKHVSAESIARLADQGQSVSRFFADSGRMMPPIRRLNVGLTDLMLNELDVIAGELNISRQAVIKTLLRQGLDRYHLANSRRSQIQSNLRKYSGRRRELRSRLLSLLFVLCLRFPP